MSSEDIGLLMRRAQSAVLSHDWDEAERLYKRVLGGDRRNTKVLSLLGSVYVKRGSDEKAKVCYAQILNIDKNNYDAMNALGGIYRRLEMYDKSIEVLRRALETHENDVQTNYNLGFTYRRMEKWDEAIECFKIVIRENPRDVLAYNHLGAIYALQKDFEKAVASYRKGLQIDPNHPVLLLNMARSLEAMGNHEGADDAYQAALKSKPGWLDAVKWYSDFLVSTNNTAQASDLVKKSILLYPEDAGIQSLLGRIYLKQCNYDNAAKTFEKASDIDENDLDAVRGLAEAYEKTDRVKEALTAIKKAEDISCESDSVEKQYASLLLTSGGVDEAGQKIRAVYNKNKQDPETLDLCGQYFIVKNEDDKAKNAWKKINAADPTYKEHEKNAAERYKQIGKFDKAREYIERYLSENDDDAEAYMVLGRLEEGCGNDDIARECFRLALERDEDNVLARNETNRLTLVTKYKDKNRPPVPSLTADPCESSPEYEKKEEDDFMNDDLFADDEKTDEGEEKTTTGAADKAIAPKSDKEGGSGKDEEEEEDDLFDVVEDDKEDEEFWSDFEESEKEEAHAIESNKLVAESDKREEVETKADEDKAEESVQEVKAAEDTLPAMQSAGQVQYVPSPYPQNYAVESALLNKMQEVAEKAWSSAQAAADNAQAAEEALRKMQEERSAEAGSNKAAEDKGEGGEESAAEEAKEAEEAESEAEEVKDSAMPSQYSAELSLFHALKDICSNALTGEKKEAFLHSRERVMLDYIIARLEGHKGLMNAASHILEGEGESGSGRDNKPLAATHAASPSSLSGTKALLEKMRSLAQGLSDKSLSVALDKLAEKAINN